MQETVSVHSLSTPTQPGTRTRGLRGPESEESMSKEITQQVSRPTPSAREMAPAIEMIDLCKTFGMLRAVDHTPPQLTWIRANALPIREETPHQDVSLVWMPQRNRPSSGA